MKIVATTLKHMDLQTTLNHYVDFTYPKDTFSVVHRLDTRQDLPGPSGWLQRRITHGSGGLLGAVLQVANSDPVLERESLMCHLLGMAGASTRGASSAVRRRRGHIMRHTPDALYREDAAALAVSDPCASDAVVGREDDAWAQQLQGVAVSDYAEALVLGVFGFGEGRRRLGLPVAEASSGQGVPRLGRDLSHVYRLSPNTCWRVCVALCAAPALGPRGQPSSTSASARLQVLMRMLLAGRWQNAWTLLISGSSRTLRHLSGSGWGCGCGVSPPCR